MKIRKKLNKNKFESLKENIECCGRDILESGEVDIVFNCSSIVIIY